MNERLLLITKNGSSRSAGTANSFTLNLEINAIDGQACDHTLVRTNVGFDRSSVKYNSSPSDLHAIITCPRGKDTTLTNELSVSSFSEQYHCSMVAKWVWFLCGNNGTRDPWTQGPARRPRLCPSGFIIGVLWLG